MNAPTPTTSQVDINARVAQYVKLRDLISEEDDKHKQKMKPYRETLEQLNGVLLQHLKAINADSAATAAGTVYRTEKASASIADMTAFWTYVVTQGEFDLLDKRANKTAVSDFIEKNNTPPPGVNYSVTQVVGVRRK